jgi:hypothetical protein
LGSVNKTETTGRSAEEKLGIEPETVGLQFGPSVAPDGLQQDRCGSLAGGTESIWGMNAGGVFSCPNEMDDLSRNFRDDSHGAWGDLRMQR